MVRKFFAVMVALTLIAGGLFADDITGVFKKFEDGKVTLTPEGSKDDKSYKVNADAKVKTKKGEILLTESFKNWKEGQKATFTVEKDEITKAKKVK
jgi:hypothetical protein